MAEVEIPIPTKGRLIDVKNEVRLAVAVDVALFGAEAGVGIPLILGMTKPQHR